MSDEDKENIHAGIIPYVAECSKEFGVTEEQINEAKKSGQVDGIDPCLMGCIFKKVGVVSKITFKGVLKLNCIVSPAFIVIPLILWEWEFILKIPSRCNM